MFMKWNWNNTAASRLHKININQRQLVPTNRSILSTQQNKETHLENLDPFFYGDNKNGFYLPTVGTTNLKLNEPTELIADQASIFFKILDAFRIPYALFAGSSIGLIRNAKTLPFSDDYDIIILNQHVPLLATAIPLLKKHGFKIVQSINPDTKQKSNGGCTVYSSVIHKYYDHANNHQEININDHINDDTNDDNIENDSDINQDSVNKYFKKSHFQCDIFFSYFDNNGFLRNNAMWGLYHEKNIHKSEVLPFQRRTFDGISLPFFKNVAAEVHKCYGNIQECIVESHNIKTTRTKYKSWKTAHAEFEQIKNNAKDNTVKEICKNNGNDNNPDDNNDNDHNVKNVVPEKNVMKIMDNTFSKNSLHILREIGKKKITTVYSFSMDFIIQHAACIKYYFPTVQIEYFSYSRDNQVVTYLNYVDALHAYNPAIRAFYDDPRVIYLKKPRIDIINVVTFGTFDMWHIGHSNILSGCCKYSENVCVGVSSDEFTFQKKQVHPIDSFETRATNAKRCKFVRKVFEETSMELKNQYIQMCGANILIMGDDWLNAFDWISCCAIYLPRTPNISSTMLREQMIVKKSEDLTDNAKDNAKENKIKKHVTFL
jgi:glycerol-3-phosphate cytidylyltransferase